MRTVFGLIARVSIYVILLVLALIEYLLVLVASTEETVFRVKVMRCRVLDKVFCRDEHEPTLAYCSSITGRIFIRSNVEEVNKNRIPMRYIIAHEFAHKILHAGNIWRTSKYVSASLSEFKAYSDRCEKEAHQYAIFLLKCGLI